MEPLGRCVIGFLTINGLPIPVALGSMKRPTPEEIGSRERMQDGSLRSSRRATKRRLEIALPLMSWAEKLEAYEGLLRGDGHVWQFGAGGLYSSKALGPLPGFVASVSPTGGRFAGRLTIPGFGVITFPAGLPVRWTVMAWQSIDGAPHRHCVVRSDGKVWTDGALDGAADSSWVVVSGGAVTIASIESLNYDYSDLVVLPYLVPPTWPALIAARTRPFSLLPDLEVYGDALLGSSATAPVIMRGEVGDAEYQPARINGVLDKTAQRLSATLREV